MWIPPEDVDPVLLHAPTRKQMAVFGAVCPADGRLLTVPAATFNAQSFRAFLVRLLNRRGKGRVMVVVLDNARWHHARALRPWLRSHGHVIRLEFLPPYSPDLNPVERVWKLTRRLCTHNVYFDSLQKLIQSVQQRFGLWSKPNRQLRRLCAII